MVDGETVVTTPDHPFLTEDRGWVDAGDLRPGDQLVSATGHHGAVFAVVTRPGSADMWDLTVDTTHTFAVGHGGWVVHNCDAAFELTGTVEGHAAERAYQDSHLLIDKIRKAARVFLIRNRPRMHIAGMSRDTTTALKGPTNLSSTLSRTRSCTSCSSRHVSDIRFLAELRPGLARVGRLVYVERDHSILAEGTAGSSHACLSIGSRASISMSRVWLAMSMGSAPVSLGVRLELSRLRRSRKSSASPAWNSPAVKLLTSARHGTATVTFDPRIGWLRVGNSKATADAVVTVYPGTVIAIGAGRLIAVWLQPRSRTGRPLPTQGPRRQPERPRHLELHLERSWRAERHQRPDRGRLHRYVTSTGAWPMT